MNVNIPSKKKLPKSYMRLPEYEKQAINKAMQELYDEALDKEEVELQKIWLQFACIVLHRHFGFGKVRAMRFLGAWKRLYKQNERCGNKDSQAEFLKSHMDKIFGYDGYPYEWGDKLAGD